MAKPYKVIRLQETPDGRLVPTVVSPKKKVKSSRGLKGVEKLVRQVAEATATFGSDYLQRHEKSASQQRDGWLRQLDKNLVLSMSKGRKKLPRMARLY